MILVLTRHTHTLDICDLLRQIHYTVIKTSWLILSTIYRSPISLRFGENWYDCLINSAQFVFDSHAVMSGGTQREWIVKQNTCSNCYRWSCQVTLYHITSQYISLTARKGTLDSLTLVKVDIGHRNDWLGWAWDVC